MEWNIIIYFPFQIKHESCDMQTISMHTIKCCELYLSKISIHQRNKSRKVKTKKSFSYKTANHSPKKDPRLFSETAGSLIMN